MKKIKKVLTALLNEDINNELKNIQNIEIISNDLLYQEAVLECLEQNKDIDFLLLNENLPGENIEKFIQKLENIKIILFTENSGKSEKFFKIKTIYKIFTMGELSVDKILEILKTDEDNYTEKLEKEIEELKRKINENKKEENNFKKIIKSLIRKIKKEKVENKTNKIISITGNDGDTKALLSIILARKLKRKKLKTLIIDLDLLNMKIFKLLNIENNEEQNINVENHIINKSKNLSVLSGKNLLFKINEKISIEEIRRIIKKLKEKYKYIIVDTSKECFFELNKMILEDSNSIFFIIDKSIEEIEKSKNILEIYWKNWKIDKSKFNIIISKMKKEKMELKIIDKIPYQQEKGGKWN